MARETAQRVHSKIVEDLPEVQNGLFRVATDGRVYRRKKDYFVLAPQSKTSRNGMYLCVSGMVDKKQKNFYVHRLIAEAYLPNPENKSGINHIDGNGHNNDISNLEWATQQENIIHAYENGMVATLATKGINCIHCAKLTLNKNRVCSKCIAKRVAAENLEERKVLLQKQLEPLASSAKEMKMSERSLNIINLRMQGLTLESIGEVYGVSRERIRQIIKQEEKKANKLDKSSCKTPIKVRVRQSQKHRIVM